MVNVLLKKSTLQSSEGKILQSTNKKYTYDKDGKNIINSIQKLQTFDKRQVNL